ncbi:MAG: metallophosphatase family protein [Desulfurococcales archaeon]|nr:metallophosphatase family protein [Desulfurococcales archaeon]
MPRILVLSDIHGNLPALEAVLEAARGWDEVVVLGDLVDYGPWPGEVIDELRGLGASIVRGNHDHAVAYGVDCRCGEATHWLSTWFRSNVTLRLLDKASISFLRSLPTRLETEIAGARAVLVHAAPSNPLYTYLHPWLGDDRLCSLLRPGLRLAGGGEGVDCPRGLYLVGHTHHQFYRTVNGAVVANPGSVGQPRDGDPRAAYMVLDDSTGLIALGRVKYDVGRVLQGLGELGVPEPYLGALKYMLVNARIPPRRAPAANP